MDAKIEAAYRRGYAQALCRAIDLIDLGAKRCHLAAWERDVVEWRESCGGEHVPPPEPVLPA